MGQEKEQESRGAGGRSDASPHDSLAALEGREQSKQRMFYEDFTAAVIPELSLLPRSQSSSQGLLQNYRTRENRAPKSEILASPPAAPVRDFIPAAEAAPGPD